MTNRGMCFLDADATEVDATSRHLKFNRPSFQFQPAILSISNDGLSRCESLPFGLQKVSFCKVKDRILENGLARVKTVRKRLRNVTD